jgi:hypothetical protein
VKIFVSYTLQDGTVTKEALRALEENLQGFGEPYIHLFDEYVGTNPQAHVVSELGKSDLLYGFVTPGFFDSEWVQLEMSTAKALGIPIVFGDSTASNMPSSERGIATAGCVRLLRQ